MLKNHRVLLSLIILFFDMKTQDKLIILVNQYRKIELWYAYIKLIASFFFILIAPVIIWLKIKDGELFLPVVLFASILIIVFMSRDLLREIEMLRNLTKKISQLISIPELVTEIFIYPSKISIDIKEAENFDLKLKDGDLKKDIIDCFEELFSESVIYVKL